jgi:L-serine dehydratase
MLSVLDLFRVGIGPSSSHTVGPIRIAGRFVRGLRASGQIDAVRRIEVHLQGSLAWTGIGHATPKAVLLGLLGFEPETINADLAEDALANLHQSHQLPLPHGPVIEFNPETGMVFDYETAPDLHPNAMRLLAWDGAGAALADEAWYSTGGGFIASRAQLLTPLADDRIAVGSAVPFNFGSGDELLAMCVAENLSIAEIVLANEDTKRPREETCAKLDAIAGVMLACIERGLTKEGTLPGGLKVRRRAPGLWQTLQATPQANERETLFDWLNVYAMAVNEENAAGGQVVTAPTNGAAGIIPAILRHYCHPAEMGPDPARTFLATAGGIGLLYKQRASISGAEMGCQGEVGVACSMAAAGLAAVWGGTAQQIANAAEIGMEHNLGLTCDPVGGLVQIPCIERNAIGAVKAANAARLALHSLEQTRVSLDQVIETMRQTGLDMSAKYKETSQGGLAVNVVEC